MIARSSPTQPTLRQLRQARGWRQQALALRLGAEVTVVSSRERGVAVPHLRTRQRLAELFGVGVGEIAFGSGEDRSGPSD